MSSLSLFEQASDFLSQYYEETEQGGLSIRLEEVKQEIAIRGTYRLSEEELVFGAKLAWRNSNRCMGRLFWKSLKVRDRRNLRTVEEISADTFTHIDYATNGGKIRSTLTVYASADEGDPEVRIFNKQLLRYAGYQKSEGEMVGDPDSLPFTRYCESLGWSGKGTPFDLLPLVLQVDKGPVHWIDIPEEKVLSVPIVHPEHPWLAEAKLQWYAVPVISDMRLEIGGLSFPCAPFNGWYMLTEIAARNFGDAKRYNVLPWMAKKLKLSTRNAASLWKDKTLLLLQEAVLYSFQQQGVTLVDHHTASEQFMEFCKREESKGREVQAAWDWIVPPSSASTLEVFHQQWKNQVLSPNFFYQTPPWQRAQKTPPELVSKCPFSSN
jgi:nitric-oxide synthase